MKLCVSIFGIILIGSVAEADGPPTSSSDVVFRDPFTLKLRVDADRSLDVDFQKIPYVHKGSVYLFSGEEFGISLKIEGKRITEISYHKDPKRADVRFKFSQDWDSQKSEGAMNLIIDNHTQRKILFDGLMTTPKNPEARQTSILPVGPGMTNYESWPHPIIQLVLRNIRLEEETETEPLAPPNRSQSRGR